MQDLLLRASRIRLVIFDVDGVLTDGRLYFGNDGNETKAFHVRDGHGIRMLMNQGIETAVISGRQAVSVTRRMADLGVSHVQQGVHDKGQAFEELRARLDLPAEAVAFVGDDVIDLPVMTRVGFAVAVADADPFVVRHAHWQTRTAGGRGAVREVAEFILAAQGRLDAERARHLS